MTEAAGYVYSRMDEPDRKRFVRMLFGPEGNRYGFCRTVIQSSDFALGPRMYVKSRRDAERGAFSLEDDRLYELPLLKDACAANPELRFLATPWSPPAWAKTNASMKRGGRLRRKYYGAWARIIARYIADYRAEGIGITHLTVQNEPSARQAWESCLFSAEQERDFVRSSLRPALDDAGLSDVRVLIWDHNKEGLVDRIAGVMRPEGLSAAAPVDGAAFHWYSGDHFEAVRAARDILGPGRDLVLSEACDAYSGGDLAAELAHAEHYAREVVGDLEAGANAVLDWNILLDARGGPNHVGNFCDAPVMYDEAAHDLRFRLPYCYLGHFSRFIRPGARRLLSTCYTVQLETTAFQNPDGSGALVVLNRNGWKVDFAVNVQQTGMEKRVAKMVAPPHSIMTLTW